jgi:hypothetical protein
MVRDLIEVGVSPAPSSNDRGCLLEASPELVNWFTSSLGGFLGLGGGKLASAWGEKKEGFLNHPIV